jgi:hypothetical protein
MICMREGWKSAKQPANANPGRLMSTRVIGVLAPPSGM